MMPANNIEKIWALNALHHTATHCNAHDLVMPADNIDKIWALKKLGNLAKSSCFSCLTLNLTLHLRHAICQH